jgi:anti-sigma B factor antagonist
MAIDIEVTAWPGATVVVPKGDLDLAAADPLRRALTALIDRRQARLVVDLGRVLYIDSSGLGVLVAAMKQARAAGGDVRLCGLEPDVHAIFEMARLAKIMDIYPSLREALATWE